MKKFVEIIINHIYDYVKNDCCPDESCWTHLNKNCDKCDSKKIMVSAVIDIITKLSNDYDYCYKDCSQCEAYDKEKHYCPKFCKLIKDTIEEIEDNHNNDFCYWQYHRTIDDIPMYESSCYHEFEKRFVRKYKYCPYCGKKIQVKE